MNFRVEFWHDFGGYMLVDNWCRPLVLWMEHLLWDRWQLVECPSVALLEQRWSAPCSIGLAADVGILGSVSRKCSNGRLPLQLSLHSICKGIGFELRVCGLNYISISSKLKLELMLQWVTVLKYLHLCVSTRERTTSFALRPPQMEGSVNQRIYQTVGHAEKENGQLQIFAQLKYTYQAFNQTISTVTYYMLWLSSFIH